MLNGREFSFLPRQLIILISSEGKSLNGEKIVFITLYLGRCREQKCPEYPDLMTAYSHPREQQPLPPGQQGDFSVSFLNIQQTEAT